MIDTAPLMIKTGRFKRLNRLFERLNDDLIDQMIDLKH